MKKQAPIQTSAPAGLTQLTLVEHALCPLDAASSLRAGFCYETSHRFTDSAGSRQSSQVRINCSDGLSASDEFYLWGLLALTFAQPDASPVFLATPHYCLSRLGVVPRGGKTYRLFRESLSRLAGVRYENDFFYDPVRKQHRRVRFGLLGYSLPLDERSSRAWRIVWDAQFFEFCRATGGSLRFDLDLYRRLDPASRRLFLMLQKVFYRRKVSPRFGVRELAVATLGFSASLPTRKLKAKLSRCADALVAADVLAGAATFTGRGDSGFVRFRRGRRFNGAKRQPSALDSSLADQLVKLGLDEGGTGWVLRTFRPELVALWCDVTQAAVEERGADFFRRNPAAFLIDNLKAAKRGERTPPDWFIAVQKSEQRRLAQIAKPRDPKRCTTPSRALAPNLRDRELIREMTTQFIAAGQLPSSAKKNAERFAQAKRLSAGRARDTRS